jgi:hypothetical protein
MRKSIDLSRLLSSMEEDPSRQLGLFALVNLGVVELLANGALSAAEAIPFFFNAQNCLYARKQLRHKLADAIMSHGVQLEDLFEALPEKEAQQEFQRELRTLRSLALQLLDQHELVA